jgi:hypothetical protein
VRRLVAFGAVLASALFVAGACFAARLLISITTPSARSRRSATTRSVRGWADRNIEDAYVTFALNPDGSIERMTMRAISPVADFGYDYQDVLFPERP